MNPTQIRKINDLIYQALFGKTTLQLLMHFNIPMTAIMDTDDNALRDCMGTLALQALGDVEFRCTECVRECTAIGETWSTTLIRMNFMIPPIAATYKAQAAGEGIDLLTGFALNTELNL